MDYRDERDALRGRVENLEQALGEAQERLAAPRGDDSAAKVAHLERQLAAAQGMLHNVQRELATVKGAPEAPVEDAPPASLGKVEWPMGENGSTAVALLGGVAGPLMLLIGLCTLTAAGVHGGGQGRVPVAFVGFTVAGEALVTLFIVVASVAARRVGPAPFRRAAGWEVLLWGGLGALLFGAVVLVLAAWGGSQGSVFSAGILSSWVGAAGLGTFFVAAPRVR